MVVGERSETRHFRNGKLLDVGDLANNVSSAADKLLDVGDLANNVTSRSDSAADELQEFMCKMCEGIPQPESTVSRFRQLLRTVSGWLGLNWQVLNVPSNVATFHDLVGDLITDGEARRLFAEFPSLSSKITGSSDHCLPFSLLKGRCVLVVNTASK